jgi:hypothetical protein
LQPEIALSSAVAGTAHMASGAVALTRIVVSAGR